MFRYLPRNMNGILAVEKPSGVLSSKVVLQLQSIFDTSDVFAHDLAEAKLKVHDQLTKGTRWLASKIANRVKKTKIKVGHGGTLDPLASGVLIIGVGTGTKKLSYYLGECTKTYETRAVLGQSTTTGDSEGEVLTRTETEHVTLESLKNSALKFVGKSKQTPPIYSALKVDGKPLYEYAREGIPLPKAIKARDIQVDLFEVHDDFGPSDKFDAIKIEPDADGNTVYSMLANNPTLNDLDLFFSDEYMANDEHSTEDKNTHIEPKLLDVSAPAQQNLPVFHATATVGSGTYIRSLISDLGRAVASSAFMVELIRVKQSDWELGKNVFKMSDFERDERIWGPVLKRVFDVGSSIELEKEFDLVTEKIGPLLAMEECKKEQERDGEEENGEKVKETVKEESNDKVSAKENEYKEKENSADAENREEDIKRRKISTEST
ncbi:CIC11C00000001553 [Sungouiella intermedia]|uniref:tRNA pseudouridine(55) synthase n=1 Tax=Sungouiella intermedia TaxID=45354 RepID=A0A1L0BTU0_9ASCO|nr:CIC11C00000001553 [[Candida] intermedia]